MNSEDIGATHIYCSASLLEESFQNGLYRLVGTIQYFRLPLEYAHIALGALFVKNPGDRSTDLYGPVGTGRLFLFANDRRVFRGEWRRVGISDAAARDKTQNNNHN